MKSLNKLIAVFIMSIPIAAFALDIGNIKVHSELYEPLNADIQLTDTTGVPAKELRIIPAPADAYYLRGIAFDPVINQLNFGIRRVNGNEVIAITSSQPVTEPIINFLVQFQWPQGEIIKKITLLPQLPGQGDNDMPLVVKAPDPMQEFNKKLNKELNQDISLFKMNAEKIWQETVNKIIALRNQYNHST